METSGRRAIYRIVGVLYILFLSYLLFFAYFRVDTETSLNLIPFTSIIEFFTDFKLRAFGHWFANIPGNVIAFIPIPIIAASCNLEAKRFITKLLIALLIPASIETIQYMSSVGQANIDDVLLNSIGFGIGFRIVSKRTRHSPPKF